jgi:septal ring factor EnvC (AmiA/AmiB activator)
VKTVGASTDKSLTSLLKKGEKKYDDAEKALDKLKAEYDAVFKKLSDLEKKEKKEDEKKKKWWYNLFISILHIFVPSSKKVLKKKR